MKTQQDIEVPLVTDLTPELLDALLAEAEAGPDRAEFVAEVADHDRVTVIERTDPPVASRITRPSVAQ